MERLDTLREETETQRGLEKEIEEAGELRKCNVNLRDVEDRLEVGVDITVVVAVASLTCPERKGGL